MTHPGPAASGPVIHMFWYGPALSRLERLSMASFVANGHHVKLHVYDAPSGVPTAVELVDAAATLPESFVFRYKSGSVAGFANWFRYRLLYAEGGIWSDTDVVCLRPFDFPRPEVFAWEDEKHVNVAVLGLPKGDPIAAWMARSCESPNRILPYDGIGPIRHKLKRRFLHGNARGDIRWGENGPHGFTRALEHFGRLPQALPSAEFYPVHWREWLQAFEPATPELSARIEHGHAVHLWNEMARRKRGFDKDAAFPADSLFEQWCRRYLNDR
jgi:hypothetical protein